MLEFRKQKKVVQIMQKLFSWIFITVVTLSSSHANLDINKLDPETVATLNHPNFLLFRRGENRKIMEQDATSLGLTKQAFGSAKLNPIRQFQTLSLLQRQTTRSLLRSYLRYLYTNQYIVTEPSKYPEIEVIRKVFPVLRFDDGSENYYLLIRVTDEIFDLVLLQKSSLDDSYSGKKIENYSLVDYLQTARISGNSELRIAIYEEGTFSIPRLTNLEIPIRPIDMVEALQRKKEEMEKAYKKVGIEATLDKVLSSKERANQLLEPFMRDFLTSRKEEQRKLQLKRDLVVMRLPYLRDKVQKLETEDEITLLVQNEIIRKIFDPDPHPQNCPGSMDDQGFCYASGVWGDRTWALYRKLYRITNFGQTLFPYSTEPLTLK